MILQEGLDCPAKVSTLPTKVTDRTLDYTRKTLRRYSRYPSRHWKPFTGPRSFTGHQHRARPQCITSNPKFFVASRKRSSTVARILLQGARARGVRVPKFVVTAIQKWKPSGVRSAKIACVRKLQVGARSPVPHAWRRHWNGDLTLDHNQRNPTQQPRNPIHGLQPRILHK